MKPQEAFRRAVEAHPHCPHCGTTQGLQTHHRASRGMGGRPKRSLDRFDNLLRVCAKLNYEMESNAAVAAEARDMGWKLGAWDAYDHPYFDKNTMSWWRLTEDGHKLPSDPPGYLI